MKYRKKPVVIEAVQFFYTQESYDELMKFCGNNLGSWGKDRHPDAKGWIQITTLEDGDITTAQVKHIATEGDYIIKGVQGEFYACKPDIFEQTYDKVDEFETHSLDDPGFLKFTSDRNYKIQHNAP